MPPGHLAICLFFRAPLGGLQANILATVEAAIHYGWDVSVFCPPGPFQDEYLKPRSIKTYTVDFQSSASIAEAAELISDADLIHAHPGPSRQLALKAAAINNVPVVFTIHGAWFDSVHQYANRLAAIICVSPAVFDAVSDLCDNHDVFIDHIPNGIDLDQFDTPRAVPPENGHIVIASRLDADKQVLINSLVKLWEIQAGSSVGNDLHYSVAGEGALCSKLEAAAKRLEIPVSFLGWQNPTSLAHLYQKASAVIASGRCAMEALTIGRPTLAIASAGVAEAFEISQLPNAAHSNFGGYGALPVERMESLFHRLRKAAISDNPMFARDARAFVRRHHDNAVVNQRILALYDRVLREKEYSPPL